MHKYNSDDIINLMGAIIKRAADDIAGAWPISGSKQSRREHRRQAQDAINFFVSDYFKKMSMGSDDLILIDLGLADFFKDRESVNRLRSLFEPEEGEE